MVGEFTIPKFALDLQDFPYPWTGLFDQANSLAEDGCILPGETLIDQLHALNLKDGLTKFYSASCHKCHKVLGDIFRLKSFEESLEGGGSNMIFHGKAMFSRVNNM